MIINPLSKVGARNGREAAVENLTRFQDWITRRRAEQDWERYMYRGRLSRKEVAKECSFGTSVFHQNPKVCAALKALEDEILIAGTFEKSDLSISTDTESLSTASVLDNATFERLASAKTKVEQRLKKIQEENAVLREENNSLRAAHKRFQYLEDHLTQTGRLAHP
jgi:hypothetical protein